MGQSLTHMSRNLTQVGHTLAQLNLFVTHPDHIATQVNEIGALIDKSGMKA